MKLNFGCGSELKDGYLNIDILDKKAPNYLQLNLLTNFPFWFTNIEEIISCHWMEHFSPSDVNILLKNSYGLLIPGGKIRVAVPNFKSLVTAYLTNNWSFFNILPLTELAPNKELVEIVEYGVYQYVNNENEHKSLWDEGIGVKRLQLAGFKDVKVVPYDTRIEPNCELRQRYTIVFEGVK